ncbi:hypothetical protein KC19_2G091400 [Ceratodon purpureus]|uniref:Uncharacterized protein n=1 Tax=Ceratodon purpureus TaxID=3225 RepID=A0A8T0ITN4_CERPU|nr:hypothetical protein KC19_2G091400 [Ceratodon purpureus]
MLLIGDYGILGVVLELLQKFFVSPPSVHNMHGSQTKKTYQCRGGSEIVTRSIEQLNYPKHILQSWLQKYQWKVYQFHTKLGGGMRHLLVNFS